MRLVRGAFFIIALLAVTAGWLLSRAQTAARWETPYECYEVIDGPAPNVSVGVTHQLGGGTVTAMKLEFLCNPVTKERLDNKKPTPVQIGDHLQCYEIDAKKEGQRVIVTTQFGVHPPLQVEKAKYLCEPADKSFPEGPPPPEIPPEGPD